MIKEIFGELQSETKFCYLQLHSIPTKSGLTFRYFKINFLFPQVAPLVFLFFFSFVASKR